MTPLSTFPSPLARLILCGGGGLPPAWGPIQDGLYGSRWTWDPELIAGIYEPEEVRGALRGALHGVLECPDYWHLPLDPASPWPARLATVAAWMVWQTVPIAAVVSETEGYVRVEMIDRRDGRLTKTCVMAWRMSDGAPYSGRWGDVHLSSLPTHLAAQPLFAALLLALYDVPEIRARVEAL
jgi:hypothetical protein